MRKKFKSKWIKNTACKDCGSSDARAIYENGSEYCFSCNTVQLAKTTLKDVHEYFSQNNSSVSVNDSFSSNLYNRNTVEIGGLRGVVKYIPSEVRGWLYNYGITADEIEANKIVWDEKKELLIFPYYYNKELVFWSGRYFGQKKNHPKYLSEGTKPLPILGKGDILVFVEDAVSAIKVARVTAACPLFGTYLDINKVKTLANEYKEFRVWLDFNKGKNSIAFASQCCMFATTSPIITDKDPKYYSDEEIKAWIK